MAKSSEKKQIEAIIRDIEEREDLEEKEKIQELFRDRLKRLARTNHHERGVCYYYILRLILKTHQHYESRTAKKIYRKMEHEFRKQHEIYKEKLKKKRFMHVRTKTHIGNFYRLMERFYSSLEVLYDKKDFLSAVRRAYEEKMYYRKHYFLFKGKRWRYLEYAFLDVTCKYGDSFARWGLTSLIFGLVMAGVYWLSDVALANETLRIVGADGHWFDYIYFSIVTLTSLGFGDFVPGSLLGKALTAIEVFFGFIMLGVFVNLIQKKL